MTIEVNLQSVSSAVVSQPTVTVRPSQSSTQTAENVSGVQTSATNGNNRIRQQIATENAQKADSRQTVADTQNVITQLNENVQKVSRQLEFKVDEQSGRTIIKVKDRESGEIIREIPSEEIVRIGNRIRELAESLHSSKTELTGLLLERQA